MRNLKKVLIGLVMALLMMIILSGKTDAASVNIKATPSQVENGKNVTVTVSFAEKVRAAQFKLSYDTGKFNLVSRSAGTLGANGTFLFADQSYDKDNPDTIASVTFTFTAKATGSAKFSISNIVLPVSYTTGSTSASVTVVQPSNNNNNNNSNNTNNNKKPTTPTKKPTTTTKKPTTTTRKH